MCTTTDYVIYGVLSIPLLSGQLQLVTSCSLVVCTRIRCYVATIYPLPFAFLPHYTNVSRSCFAYDPSTPHATITARNLATKRDRLL